MAHGKSPQRDLTQGPIGRTLLLFALPTLGSSILQSINGSINAIWIGQLLGERALAATTNAGLVMFLLVSAVFGFGMAATILIGQAMGRGDVDAVRRVFGTALGLFGSLSLVVVVVGWLAAPTILTALRTPADAYPLALAYLRVIFVSMPTGFLAVLLSMALRGTGDSMTPLRFMALGSLVDVALNPVLIRGLGPIPAFGIEGSAIATFIANTVAFAALLAFVYRRDLIVRLRGAEWRYLLPDPTLLKPIVTKGVPMGLQMLVATGSALAMIGLVNGYGTTTTAAYGAASQLWTYIQMPAMSVGAAVSAMVAQNIGANRWDRVSQITRSGVVLNLAMTTALIGTVAVLDRPVLGLFLGSDAGSIDLAAHINLIGSASFLLFGVAMVLSATVRANGAVVGPLVILAIALFPIRLGLASALQPNWGADAIWWSFPAGSAASMLMTIAYYHAGGWRKGRLIPQRHAEEKAIADGEPTAKQMPLG
jgi:putative MATE family efflux protein